MRNQQKKIVLITGASGGIGAACAEHFAANNWAVIITGRRETQLQAIANHLQEKYNAEVLALTFDVRDHQTITQIFADLAPEWQAIDVLINNAGLALDLAPLFQGDTADWDTVIDTNIKGLLYMTNAILPGMMARQQGHIINMGSIAGHQAYPNGAVYCATKHAVHALTQCLKQDLTGTPIRVSTVGPGAVETDFSIVRFKGDTERAKKVYLGFQPLTPQDIADVIYYCATRPAHVNISEIHLMPVAQSSATLIHRE